MGTKVMADTGGGTFAPNAAINVEDSVLRGTLVSFALKNVMGSPKLEVTLKLIDADCLFSTGSKKKGTYEQKFPQAGDEVKFLAPTLLATQIPKVPIGSDITIEHVGFGVSKKGNPPHKHDVTINDAN